MAGFCLCGCGAPVKGKWVHGHHARVNNPSKNPDVSRKKSEKLKGRKGKPAWNRGLTRETDSRVSQYGQTNSSALQADKERRSKRAESCRRQWTDGRIHAPVGPRHGQWKGGVSTLQQRCRARLYESWSRPIMIRDVFQCQRCHNAKGGDLCVHHDVERFAAILSKIVAGRNVMMMTFEEQGLVVDSVIEYHLLNQTSGLTLCRNCHDAVHAIDPDVD